MKRNVKTLVMLVTLILSATLLTSCVNPEAMQKIFNSINEKVVDVKEDIIEALKPVNPDPECEHTGGEALCGEKPVCDKCGEPYGEALEHAWDSEEGIKNCTVCGKHINPDFAGGKGTADDPYLVGSVEQLQNISKYFETTLFYKVANGVTELNGENWTSVKLNGNFDGNDVTFKKLSNTLFANVYGESATIKNFTIEADINSSAGVSAVVYKSNTLNLTIDAVDVHGTIIGGAGWVASYVVFGPGAECIWNFTVKNSLSDAQLVATSGVASGFVGHPYNDVAAGNLNGASMITIIDSAYIGSMSAKNANSFKYFTINGNSNRITTYYSTEFVEQLGFNPEGTLYAPPVNAADYPVVNNEDGSKTFLCGNYGKNVKDYYVNAGKTAILNTAAQAVLPENVGDTFTVNKVDGAVSAVVSLQIAPNTAENYGAYLGTYMTETIDLSKIADGGIFNTNEVKYFEIKINGTETDETGVNGNVFNVVNDFYGVNAHNGATVYVVQFDADGNVLNITSVVIATPHLAE